MPRLQSTRRTSLLATGLRKVFLEAFTRQTALNDVCDAELGDLARRVQTDIQQVTGHYYPLHQVVLSMHDLKRQPSELPSQSTPNTLRVAITEPTPNTSMSRRRIERNIPALQCQLRIPPPVFSLQARYPASATPSSLTPTNDPFSFGFLRRNSLPSGSRACSPITPIDQILHTPPSPPKLPRLAPPPTRTWARLNVEARMGETSPLDSPGLPLTPYMLNPMGKPLLRPLQIPGTLVAGGPELRDRHLTPSPLSPQPLSPLELTPTVAVCTRPSASRTTSSSNLARTALLRTSRPGLARSFSLNGHSPDNAGDGSLLSPFAAPASSSPIASLPLASPFVVRPEAMDGGYFARV
ncbi:hypothetical protein C8Q76DRAFT_772169 [Earliella scabrosa]|nr:hypothetical protein C8Q76DRAFT_772169 [Earliella scabrosa]